MKRVFKIGERVWWNDDHMYGWGTIALINREETYKEYPCSDYNGDILTITKDSGGEIETTPSRVYQEAYGYTFFGMPLVWEHDEEIDYPLYCPDRDENVYMCEVDAKDNKLFKEPVECEFYSVEDDKIHVSGFLWKKDDGTWALTQYTFCYIPITELLDAKHRMELIDEYESEVQQYEHHGLTDEQALTICNSYANGQRILSYGDITYDTKNGNYVSRV